MGQTPSDLRGSALGATAAQLLLRWGLQMGFQIIPKPLGRLDAGAATEECAPGTAAREHVAGLS